jgi:hypothetical protein
MRGSEAPSAEQSIRYTTLQRGRRPGNRGRVRRVSWRDVIERQVHIDGTDIVVTRTRERDALYSEPSVNPPRSSGSSRNLLHLARMLKDVGGVPAHGNQRSEWDAGCRFDFPNPEHR